MALKKTTCAKTGCNCTKDVCAHDCCISKRKMRLKHELSMLRGTRDMFLPSTPTYKTIENRIAELNNSAILPNADPAVVLDFEPIEDDEDYEPPATLRQQINSQNKQGELHRNMLNLENKINRLTQMLKPLKTSSIVIDAMTFFYEIQARAPGPDMDLALQVAELLCAIPRFNTILRLSPHTMEGWTIACNTILQSIDNHFLASAKSEILRCMSQGPGEDPQAYSDRVVTKIDAFTYFSAINGKIVEAPEMARHWVDGLDLATRNHVSTILTTYPEYTITSALNLARAYNRSNVLGATTQAPLQTFWAPKPEAPPMKDLVQQLVTEELRSFKDQLAANTAPTTTQHNNPTPNQWTMYPCILPICNGAHHRYHDCPNRQPCRFCPKIGHHSEVCFNNKNRLTTNDPKRPNNNYRNDYNNNRNDYNNNRNNQNPQRYTNNDRSSNYNNNSNHNNERSNNHNNSRSNNRDRSPARPKDRARERDRSPNRTTPTPKPVAPADDGNRLND